MCVRSPCAASPAKAYPGADAAVLDGVRVSNRSRKAIGRTHLPERCDNLCFRGGKNRGFMAARQSLYALFIDVQGVV